MMPAAANLREGDPLRIIRDYYACFNERRFADAAAMFTEDAVLEQVPFQGRQRGPAAYRVYVELWTRAFPDLMLEIADVTVLPDRAVEAQLVASGTHMGDLSIGGCVFRPTGVATKLRLRELIEFRGDRLAASVVSFDLQELANQLTRVDDTQLLMHLSRLRYMEGQLRNTTPHSEHRLTLLESIGRELDSARRVLRPYFTK
jgi:predicted ester cyclase